MIRRNNKIGSKILLTSIIIITLLYLFPKQLSDTKKKPELKEEKYKVSLIAAGDNLIHKSIYNDAKTNDNTYNFIPIYELIKPISSKYDIAYYNQETILGGKELGVSDYPVFNSPKEVGDAMIDAGFNLVSTATNHTIDRGETAILKSREYWNSKKDVLAVGSYSNNEDRDKIRIMEKNNISYSMLNYTYGTNGIKVPTGKEYLVNVWPTNIEINDPKKDLKYQEYKKQVKQDIDKLRNKIDILIVAMHWGIEYVDEPTEYEKDMANFLANNKVDIIIGTHPHVIQPITWINNTLVIYSLGNLISAQYQNQDSCLNYKCTTGLMTSLEIEKTVIGKNKKIKILNVNNELIYTYYNNWKNFKVIPFSNSNIVNYLPNYKDVYETYKNIVTKYDKNIQVNNCY